MRIINIHSRHINAPATQIWPLLLTLGSTNDLVWPHEDWPRMKLDRPMQAGAVGGHGPIHYRVSICEPSQQIRFEFIQGSVGFHEVILRDTANGCLLTHTIDTRPELGFFFKWHFIIRFMHDAVIEDLFDKLQAHIEPLPKRSRWTAYVKLLRTLAGGSTQSRLLA
ncbi:SRPBCC family protein [Variovorax sp. PCZ-1]|uniref:SRPBCC family protein n=1 Tax=Variovorax sp. PCZ-1 TaxID=2835533 RepID=UPI001BCBE77F|nr:SRPBCC family protein [Variovorax sp. PCZ-1]MBS7808438.1 SRPBCC family protein [Variovorax sp. PCZ-1]